MQFEENVILAPLTTLRVGGPAALFARAGSVDDIHQAASYAREHALPLIVLGDGSNVLIPDGGFNGVVIKNELRGISFQDDGASVIATVSGGENWDTFVKEAVHRGLWGVENLSGIPGTVGATPVQNVGAYGSEIAEYIEWVDVFDMLRGEPARLAPTDCKFDYRDSIFKHEDGKRYVIVAVCLRLSREGRPNLAYHDLAEHFDQTGEDPTLPAIRRAVLAIRKRKFPASGEYGTAGSFFKNPIISSEEAASLRARHPHVPLFPVGQNRVKVPLAWLLDHVCGLRGAWHGVVGSYEHQPLVLVTRDGATARDLAAFAEKIEKDVHDKTGVRIEREVTCL